jgi:FkbM family methyltransferase
MKVKKSNITYAQNREDLILAALLYDVKKGTYIDIGANDPEIDSVTKYFYQKGWTGVNVEPISKLHRKLAKKRRRDTNLNIGISNKNGTLILREYIKVHGHSTFAEISKRSLDQSEEYKQYEVSVITLSQLYSDLKLQHVHFLKIDVEGLEYEVVQGNNWEKNRPEVICIEADHKHKSWKEIFNKFNYELVIFDGLNEYYLAQESNSRLVGLSERLVAIGHNALKNHQYIAWHDDYNERKRLEKEVRDLNNKLHQVQGELTKITQRSRPISSKIREVKRGLSKRNKKI